MYLADLCIIFLASVSTVQYRGLRYQRVFGTLGHPRLTQEKRGAGVGGRGEENSIGWRRIYSVGLEARGRREYNVIRASISQYYRHLSVRHSSPSSPETQSCVDVWKREWES